MAVVAFCCHVFRRATLDVHVTRILSQIHQGNPTAAEQLLPLVYDELRKADSGKLVQEKPGQTLQATALVHEAYRRLLCGADAAQRRLPCSCFGADEEAG